MIKHPYLLFDLDGTLVDSVPDLALSLNILRAEVNLPPLSQQQTAAIVGDGARLLVKRALGEELYTPAQLDRFLDIYNQHLLDNTTCFPGIATLLQRHSPDRMAVVTNKPYLLSVKLLDGLGLSQYFKVVIGGDSFPQKKPDPMPVSKALEVLGASPEQAVMIGDHHTDINSGRAAGTAVCFCAYGMGHDDGLTTDYYAAQPADLIKLFPGQTFD